MNKAIFLDRDGVINYDPDDYIYRMEDFRFLDNLFEIATEVTKRGYKIIVITNQGGIDKNRYSANDVERIHAHVEKGFKENGTPLTEIYYCPHHSDLQKCMCRKPGSLMVERALAKYNIDPSKSFFIGDKQRDIVCAEGAGVRGIKIDVNQMKLSILDKID
ncbi:MAG: HAD family hydrolase [Bacteroidetes bacterium]|nr:HAD family hydrolase [Bacteroidota bacterium]